LAVEFDLIHKKFGCFLKSKLKFIFFIYQPRKWIRSFCQSTRLKKTYVHGLEYIWKWYL